MVQKFAFIPDVHGRIEYLSHALSWCLAKGYFPVFLGDLVDSLSESRKNQRKCLSLVEALNPNKIHFLPGNHELSYIYESHRSSGYFRSGKNLFLKKISNLVNRYKPYWYFKVPQGYKVVYGERELDLEYLLASHAGLHPNYYPPYTHPIEMLDKKWNELGQFMFYKQGFINDVGMISGGFQPVGGMVWLRPNEWKLSHSKYPGLYQIVGHTGTNKITFSQNRNVFFADCWDIVFQILVLVVDHKAKTVKLIRKDKETLV